MIFRRQKSRDFMLPPQRRCNLRSSGLLTRRRAVIPYPPHGITALRVISGKKTQISRQRYLIMERSSWKAASFSARQDVAAFYVTWKFITVFTTARHLSLSWSISIQSTISYPLHSRSILILSPYLRSGLQSGLPSAGFPASIPYEFDFSSIHATCPNPSLSSFGSPK